MTAPLCPVCRTPSVQSPIGRIQWLKEVAHDLQRCPACDMRFISPWPTADEFERFYHAGYYTFDADAQEGKGWYWTRYLNAWKPEGSFLDVGCATGHLIRGIQRHSQWHVAGVEFSEAAVRYAKDTLKLEVRQGALTDVKFPAESFDLVHVNNVLEHVTNPVEFLAECARILKPDGRMYLSVPHGGVDAHEYGDYARLYKRPPFNHNGHVLYFSKDALSRAFDKAGLVVEKAYTTNIRRGLKLTGWWPRKPGWHNVYALPERESLSGNGAVPLQDTGKRRPLWYHWWRNAKGEIFRVPGIHPIGLDLVFFLRKK